MAEPVFSLGHNESLSRPQGPPSHPLTCAELKRRHLPLLELEHIAEVTRREELADLSQLKGLLVAGIVLTPHGLRLWVLRPVGEDRRGAMATGMVLPSHNIRAREPVEVTRQDWQGYGATRRAVAYQVTDYEVVLAVDNDRKLVVGSVVNIQRVNDDHMYENMRGILRGLDAISGRARQLRAVLLGERPAESPRRLPESLLSPTGRLQFFNAGLNRQQREAVEFAVRQKHLAVIHGPPGTGKTTTIVEIMLQHLKLGYRILACAHSNTAVDSILQRLAEISGYLNVCPSIVRLGHPARIRENLLDFSLDMIVDYTLFMAATVAMRRGLNPHLRREPQQKQTVETAQVVLCTLSNTSADGLLGPPNMGIGAFDLVVIDECSQSVEAACWLAAQRTGKLLLAGDHRQLPPTILSEPAARRGLAVSLMERQVELHGAAAVRMLCTQYRMHQLIQQWPSERHYDGRLEAAPGVRFHRLPELPGVRETADTAPTLLLIDTAGCRLTESRPDEAGSKRNDGEADIVAAHVAALVGDGVLQEQIGVITPYRAQITRVRAGLRQRYLEEVDVHTVDGFQGREKEAIVVSLVISRKGGLKFVADKRRINVAITRARRQLVIVCDTKMMSRDNDMKSLLKYMRQHGEVRTAHDYMSRLMAEALYHFQPVLSDRYTRYAIRRPGQPVPSTTFSWTPSP